MYELFELHYVWLYTFVQCMSGKFPIFLSPPVQFMSIVLQHSMEQFVSLLLSHDLDKKQLPSHFKTNKCVKFYSFYFEMHHD